MKKADKKVRGIEAWLPSSQSSALFFGNVKRTGKKK